ncbi:Bug family tripartite tricarboxylate transporter substrate binding protein [Acidovorax carolinensis]|nr:tripartite tricarboxylate transporter substrate binding protein [Acidovorax carolinensis]
MAFYMQQTRRTWLAAFSALTLALGLSAHAQQPRYPDKPLKLVVPFSAGGATDVVARAVAEKLGTRLGQNMVVENRVGAGGNIAYEHVAKSPADGYTLLFASTGLATNATLYKKLNYDALKDFAPISLVARSPHVLVVHPSVPANSVLELIALGKKQPLSFGSSGNGTILHLAGEMMKTMTGAQLQHVPYRGGTQVLTDLMAGTVQLAFLDMSIATPQIHAGKLRALATTGKERTPKLPDLPTMNEAGILGYAIDVWFGMLAPAGTPQPVVERLNKELQQVLVEPEIKQRMRDIGQELQASSSQDFSRFVRTELQRMGDIVRASNATID